MTKNGPARATGAGSLHCSVCDHAGFIASWIDASQHDADGSFAWRSSDRRRCYCWSGSVLMCCGGLLSRQQQTKSWTTGLVSLAGSQATPTWLGLTPVTGR